MTQTLATIIADFETSLSSAIGIGDTTTVIQSNLDDDGNAIPNGRYFFTVDGGNSGKEHMRCDLTGVNVSNIYSVSRQGVETVGAARAHRVGATVVITDFKHIKAINDLLNGSVGVDAASPMKYDAEPTFVYGNHEMVTWDKSKDYTDSVAIAGAPDASETVKGIVEEATQAEVDAGTQTGGTGAELFINPVKLRSKKLSDYDADTGIVNAIAITPTPSISAYAVGQRFTTIVAVTNTGATTISVSGLAATPIKKQDGTVDLEAGDLVAGQVIEVEYDLAGNFQLMTPVGIAPVTLSGGSYPTGTGENITDISASVILTASENLTSGDAVKIIPTQSEITVNTFNDPLGNNDINGVAGFTKAGFRFDVGATDAFLNYIKIVISKTGSPGNLLVKVGTSIDLSDIASTTVLEANIPGTNIESTITFSDVVKLTASTSYYITLVPAVTTGTDYVSWWGQNFFGGPGSTWWYFLGAWNSAGAPNKYLKYGMSDGTSGQIKKAKATNTTESELFIGFARTTVLSGATTPVDIAGTTDTLSALSIGKQYYLSDTPGSLSLTSGTVSKKVGTAIGTSRLLIKNEN